MGNSRVAKCRTSCQIWEASQLLAKAANGPPKIAVDNAPYLKVVGILNCCLFVPVASRLTRKEILLGPPYMLNNLASSVREEMGKGKNHR